MQPSGSTSRNAARLFVPALFSAVLLWSPHPALAQFTQQGLKLVGSGAVGNADQGSSVALSADGNTAIVGGPNDNGGAGSAWVFTRSGRVWTQQGLKLVGDGAIGNAQSGFSVALSADGNTAIVGGPSDNGGAGAAWVFTRIDGLWALQSKLIGSGAATGHAQQGSSVALSADGNTAMVGGPGDNNGAGAAWGFTRTGGFWSQQGIKLTCCTVASAQFGFSVALSGDGNTAVVGAPNANGGLGMATVWRRGGSNWGVSSLLAGNDAVGNAAQGRSVALSGDGMTAIVGGPSDTGGFPGAAWVFTFNSNIGWNQQGPKLVGTGFAPGNNNQGWSVGLSGDGNIAIVGAWEDNAFTGAAWIFTRIGGVWGQPGNKLVGTDGLDAQQGTSVITAPDRRHGWS